MLRDEYELYVSGAGWLTQVNQKRNELKALTVYVVPLV